MRTSHKALLTGALVLAFSGSAIGQTNAAPSAATPSASNSKQQQNQHRLSKIIGSDVYDAKGEKLASIKDVVVNPERGQVDYAVLSVGGIMGVGSKYFAVPWKSLQASSQSDKYVMNIDKKTLENAPGFDKDNWPDMASTQWSNDVARYWEGATAGAKPMSRSGSSGASNGSTRSGDAK